MLDRRYYINVLFLAIFTILPYFKFRTKVGHTRVGQREHESTVGHPLNTFPDVSERNFLRNNRLKTHNEYKLDLQTMKEQSKVQSNITTVYLVKLGIPVDRVPTSK